MLPFVRTPSNLFRHSLQRLPIIGMLQKQNVTMLKAGGAARSEVLGRSMLGGLLLYAAWDAAMNESLNDPEGEELDSGEEDDDGEEEGSGEEDDSGKKAATPKKKNTKFSWL